MPFDLLHRVDAYMDAVPRAAAHAEDIGSLRLFVKDVAHGWPYYARPIPGAGPVSDRDTQRVRARQRGLGLPETFEWIFETAPTCADVLRSAGLHVMTHPLMTLDRGGSRTVRPPDGVTVRIADDDDDLAVLAAVAKAGFDVPGTAVADRPLGDVDAALATISEDLRTFMDARRREGLTLTAVAEIDGRPVAVGSHQPVGAITEVVGVTTLPLFRRRGIGTAVTEVLVADAFARGVDTVVLTAGDDDVARVYERVGFRLVGTTGAAEP